MTGCRPRGRTDQAALTTGMDAPAAEPRREP
jgi:hypothetical protein